MTQWQSALMCGLAAAVAPAALAQQTVYDSLSSGTDGAAFLGDAIIDDLRLEGTAVLQRVTLALTASGSGGNVSTDVDFIIAVDGGNGIPDFFSGGDDGILLQVTAAGVEVPRGGVAVVDLDVSDRWARPPADALLFAGAMLSNPEVGHVFYGEPTVGTTDELVFSFSQGELIEAPGAADPTLPNSLALGFTLEGRPLPGPAPFGTIAGDAEGFESLDEGFHDMALSVGDLTFDEGWDGFAPPTDATIAIDDGGGLWQDYPEMLDFVQGKLLQINAFTSGPDAYSFSLLKKMRIRPDSPRTGAMLNVAYVVSSRDADFTNSDITLLALRNGDWVASDTIHPDNELATSPGGSFTFGAGTLKLAGVEFDELVLFNNGVPSLGGVQMGLDNVLLGEASCLGDVDGDGDTDVDDFFGYLDLFAAGARDADLDGDGDVDVNDFFEYLDRFAAC